MTEFSEGDLIEASKGDTVIRGRVVPLGGGLTIQAGGWDVDSFERSGFTLTVIEKAAPALPTEPGAYLVTKTFRGKRCVLLTQTGEWYDYLGGMVAAEYVQKYLLPLEPMASVSDTAKKVLDRVARSVGNDSILRKIATEFGVKDD